MEQGKKNVIMGVIIVACLAAAGVITFRSVKPKGAQVPEFKGQTVWVKCSNKDCGHAWEMPKRDYFVWIEEHSNAATMSTPPLICEKCGEESGYRAVKCEKCGLVFFWGALGSDAYSDECPECGHSAVREGRKKAAARRGGR
jgi:predicted RNA-binding Zn-ribbon protein involved in translation (DUF1610 family)